MINKDWPAYVFTGISDGLIIPFALMAGISRVAETSTQVTGYMAYVVPAAALLMALGGYFTAKSESSDFSTPVARKAASIKKFYEKIGLSPELRDQATAEQLQETKEFTYLKGKDLPTHPFAAGLLIFLSYCTGGYISLSPFFYYDDPIDALKISASLTLPLLMIFGYFKYQFLGLKGWYGGIIHFLLGAFAAAAAYAVGKLFIA